MFLWPYLIKFLYDYDVVIVVALWNRLLASTILVSEYLSKGFPSCIFQKPSLDRFDIDLLKLLSVLNKQ